MPMIKIYFSLILVVIVHSLCLAQKPADSLKKDSTKHLAGTTVIGYLIEQPVLSVPASVSVLSPAQLNLQPENSLVSALNTVPGVRMEERSPGSYRLSIRGSLLRSPFGVRDVKIYYDDIPLTDAVGNSYLNAIDMSAVQGIEILKGPDGSLFGANSGGVVLINPVARRTDSNFVKLSYTGGSYGLNHESAIVQQVTQNNQLEISQASEFYQGYRQHSNMYRNFFQLADKAKLSATDDLKAFAYYSNLKYETPGGLTLAQFNADPSLARPPSAPV